MRARIKQSLVPFVQQSVAPFVQRHRIIQASLRRASVAGLVPAGVWGRMPYPEEFTSVTPDGAIYRYRPIAGDEIALRLYWRGTKEWETATLSLFSALVRQARVFVDVGAYTGIYSLIAGAENPRVQMVAFEPVPLVSEALSVNIELNGFTSRSRVVVAAAFSDEGERTIAVRGDQPTSTSSLMWLDDPSLPDRQQVRTCTVDSVVSSQAVDVIKIDAEGAETEVLAGSTETIERMRPSIIVECLSRDALSRVHEFLRPRRYSVYHVSDSGLRKVEEPADTVGVLTNFLAVPREDISGLSLHFAV